MDILSVIVLLIGVVIAAAVAAFVAVRLAGQQAVAGSHRMELQAQAADQHLDALRHELGRVTAAVGSLQVERARQHGELISGLAETARTHRQLSTTTAQLREALASPKARGQWGERMADDVLRLAGFVEGVNYLRQRAVASGAIPDVTFLLPGGLLLHMDVKFPAANYLRALEATTAEERAAAEAQFMRDVRLRIKEVTTRGYIEAGVTVDQVLLFIPNESIYSFIHEHDPELADLALAQKVVLCSPFTLFAVLSVIRQAVDALGLARTTDDVLTVLAGFSEQWNKFGEQLDVVAKRLDSVHSAFDELGGPRRRQLQKQLDQIDRLREQRPPLVVVDRDAPGMPLRQVGAAG